MSRHLWKYYLEDDVESFCQLLDESSTTARQSGQRALNPAPSHFKLGSPGAAVASGTSYSRSYDNGHLSTPPKPGKRRFADVVLTRADVNRKDGKGMTLLHYAASSAGEKATSFALALVAHPLIDLYVQDRENGWTPLHRSLYFGNITITRAILEKEAQDKLGKPQGGIAPLEFSLIRIKDHEGNGPFDVLTATIKDRTLRHQDMTSSTLDVSQIQDAEHELDDNDEDDAAQSVGDSSATLVNLHGDEIFTFGTNKNTTLGLGNEDDRQYPERVSLKRPAHLYARFYREYRERLASEIADICPAYAEKILQAARSSGDPGTIPASIRATPVVVRDVHMAKFHSAILTDDPVCNLHICGHGLGGRLGTGNEKTQFSFVCIEDGALSKRKVVSIALGQDHTLAVTDQGELFAWGSNSHGQLGLGMSKSARGDEPLQLLPKQIFGSLKREFVCGVAASRFHSVVHTATALYTFGKNEGQLGIVDAHAGSLEIQSTPRRVAASRFSCGIQSVSAIERATVCLLENHEVHVFANYGVVKLQFPLDGFTNYSLPGSVRSTRYDDRPNTIVKITSGGETICALSSSGEIFAVTVDQRVDPALSGSASTTNPTKIRQALSQPARIWTLKKGHMNARDVGVDQDGSIVLSTEAGSVWRRIRRADSTGARHKGPGHRKSKDFKFSRVPGLTRVIAVRASASGAYSAIRRDCNVTRTQIVVNKSTFWNDMALLLPFRRIDSLEESNVKAPTPSFWTRQKPQQKIVSCLAGSDDLEKDIAYILDSRPNTFCDNYDASIGTTTSEVRIPIHSFVLASRSRHIRSALATLSNDRPWESDVLSISKDSQGRLALDLKGSDFLSLVEFVLYAYTDEHVAFWLRSKDKPELAFRYRQVRVELMKLCNRLEIRNLESTARKMIAASPPCMHLDFEMALGNIGFTKSGDVTIQLKDAEVMVHSHLLSRRCPFFEGLFQGKARGRWLADRRELLSDSSESVGIDFTHVELQTFKLVLRHLYADAGVEMFDDIVTEDVDEFLDLVLDVLGVANELMLDRLSQICQVVLGRHVNTRNVCGLLNAVALSAVPEFKNSALEYACFNLETLLTTQLLDELDDDLLYELDDVVRDNQLSTLPVVRSGRAEAELFDRHPELAARIHRDRQAKLDALDLQMKYADHQNAFGTSLQTEDDADFQSWANQRRRRSGNPLSPRILAQESSSPRLDASNSLGREGGSLPVNSPLPPTTPMPMPSVTLRSEQSPQTTSPTTWNRPPDAASIRQGTTNADAQGPSPASASPSMSWDKVPMTPNTPGLRDIMDQAASSRKSAISLGLASQANVHGRASFSGRMSQKERRRMNLQQQPQQQQQLVGTPGSFSGPSNGASSSTTPSPWQAVTRSSPSTRADSSSATAPTARSPSSTQRSATPQLTMRQTVANAPSSSKSKDAVALQPPQTPPNKRNISGRIPSSSPNPRAAEATAASSGSKPIEIQSIRHTPRADAQVSPTFYMHQSMADILSQQEAEKNTVKEAVAKRSLHDIQLEQEFLTWWDNESRRVAEEEAAAARMASGSGAQHGRGTGNSRRGRSRPGRGRGKGKQASG